MASSAGNATFIGGAALAKRLKDLKPGRKVTDAGLNESMLTMLRNAAGSQIKRGGKGKPVKGRLTSRTGTLRRSLARSQGIDDSGLSRGYIEGGTALIYGAVHEHSTSHPRPFLKPALAATIDQFEAIFVKHWKAGADL